MISNLRFVLEYIRPEIRQYFIESGTDAAPFSRAQRSLVQRAGDSDYRPLDRSSTSRKAATSGSIIR
ncbi:MAG: hypothetical protein R3E45_09515 [Rhodocyclaceae bacterium]